ncbi:unnamed protein product [Rotaria magnacalcarata]
MNLESLCHELLLDVYLFLSTVHLFRAFRGLDARFNTLIFNHVRTYGHFDFRSASKQDCDIIYQQHLPTIIDQIISLRLSNDDATPQQIERFLSRGFTFCHFIQLQSLSLFSMYSPEIMMQMIDDLRHLPNLDHLNLVDCYLGESRLRYSLETLMNLLQNMPNILHLTIETAYIDLNGYRFEPIITNYLPKLKFLQLKMCIALDNITNKEQQIDNLINSFRNSFWLDKHQWFVRCHSDFTFQSNIIWVCTLPYTFSDFNVISDNILIRSTCLQESDFYSYDCVNRFSCKSTIIREQERK